MSLLCWSKVTWLSSVTLRCLKVVIDKEGLLRWGGTLFWWHWDGGDYPQCKGVVVAEDRSVCLKAGQGWLCCQRRCSYCYRWAQHRTLWYSGVSGDYRWCGCTHSHCLRPVTEKMIYEADQMGGDVEMVQLLDLSDASGWTQHIKVMWWVHHILCTPSVPPPYPLCTLCSPYRQTGVTTDWCTAAMSLGTSFWLAWGPRGYNS